MFEQIYTSLLPVAGLAIGMVITYIFGQRKVSQRDDQIEELEGNVKTRDKKIKSQKKSLKEHEATLETLNTDLSQRDTTIQDLEEQVTERDERIVGADAKVGELLDLMQEREQEISALKAKERAMQDDFSHLDGIGPKISAILRSAGIKTFAKLAAKKVDDLREILMAENPNLLRMNDPTMWPEQAGMAAEGRWESLKALQEGLKERRRIERQSLQQSQEIESMTVVTDT